MGKGEIDIVEYIGKDVDLRRRGGGFVGLCPFHDERHPSFNVNPHTQRFVCWGCGKRGDVFDYISEKHGVGYAGAYKIATGKLPGPPEEPKLSKEENDWCEGAVEISRLWLKIMNMQETKNLCRDDPTNTSRMHWISTNQKQKVDMERLREVLGTWKKDHQPRRTTALVFIAMTPMTQPFIFGSDIYRNECLYLVEDS